MSKIIYILAPMDGVTDVVFRQMIAEAAPPDVFFTEFVNVDGLQSRGRPRLMHKLNKGPKDLHLIAQIWGKNPDNYFKAASDIVNMGFTGIDINMGCPVKNVVNSGCCSALINNRELALEIIKATKAGVNGKIPVSVKTRTGLNEVDFSWHELLLKQDISMLTIHGRTTKQQSKVPANWGDIAKVKELRDTLAPNTLIIGNGDVQNRQQGDMLATKYGLDGIMIGRAVFSDPFVFARHSPWQNMSEKAKLKMYLKHIQLFSSTYPEGPRNWEGLKRMAKVYINNIDNASDLRDTIVRSESIADMQLKLNQEIAKLQ